MFITNCDMKCLLLDQMSLEGQAKVEILGCKCCSDGLSDLLSCSLKLCVINNE